MQNLLLSLITVVVVIGFISLIIIRCSIAVIVFLKKQGQMFTVRCDEINWIIPFPSHHVSGGHGFKSIQFACSPRGYREWVDVDARIWNYEICSLPLLCNHDLNISVISVHNYFRSLFEYIFPALQFFHIKWRTVSGIDIQKKTAWCDALSTGSHYAAPLEPQPQLLPLSPCQLTDSGM